MYTLEEGTVAVKIARQVLECFTKGRPYPDFDFPKSFDEDTGVFVTINTHPDERLRGCIGYPSPIYPLRKAVVKAAEGVTEDPRFARLSVEELDGITVEVSLLTIPQLIEVESALDYPKEVEIGKDGLIVEKGTYTGLLLPQVPVEWKWNEEEFLSQTCMKAGLPPDAWFDKDTRMYRFNSEIFGEVEPRGKIVRKTPGDEDEGS
ncbi:MAG: TIGR00296 family protein [Methanomassiliicoccales archaeon]|nr:MAG: TIGR00296 family protein [Methanomassiliicoccales archaeon]